VVADRWEPASLFVVSGVPGVSPMKRGRAWNTVLDRVERKEALGRTAEFCSARLKSLWGRG
jgi:hypothetical protein